VSEGHDHLRRAALFLRQRVEAGMPPVILDGLDRRGAAELVLAARKGTTTSSRPAAPPAAEPRAAAPTTASSIAAARPPAESGDDPRPGMDYDTLREEALGCTRCALAGTRTTVVFSDGSPDARVMVVGEAPGANEDRTGLPFVGAAGKLLDLMLASVDLSREESVYICNVLKCRPPGNRNPQSEEISACSPFLLRQIELVRPEAILAVGTFAAQLLTVSQDALGKLRGTVYRYEGVPMVVTYHPAALLRNPGWSRPTWDDLQLLRGILDGDPAARTNAS
jgi:DNA polymerase